MWAKLHNFITEKPKLIYGFIVRYCLDLFFQELTFCYINKEVFSVVTISVTDNVSERKCDLYNMFLLYKHKKISRNITVWKTRPDDSATTGTVS